MKRHRGFTLLELMIVAAIVAVLAALAYPAYGSYLARTRRAEAKATLLEAVAWMERRRALNNDSYALDSPSTALANAGYGGSPRGATRFFYRIDFVGDPTDTGYTLRARVDPAVWTEPRCMELTLTESGERGASGDATADECWRK